MLKLLLLSCFAALFLFVVNCEVLNIELTRRASPRQNIIYAKQHGLDIYELENPQNATNYTLALKKYLDNEFYGSVRVGSTGQEFHVIFDTAWTTSWIMSKDCAPAIVKGCTGHTLYDHDRSATYVQNGAKYSNDQGTYNFTGYYSYDKINYGGTKVKNQSFVEMTYLPPSYMTSKADGVIGLSPSYGSETTLPELLFQKGLLKEPIFSIYLNRDTQSSKGGDIMLGAINERHIHVTKNVKDKITYVQVAEGSSVWQFKMNSVGVLKNKHILIPVCKKDCNAIIDTGSINIYASPPEIEAINQVIRAVPDGDKFAVDCATINKLPPINFVIGGQNFTMRNRDYVHKITTNNVQKCYSVFAKAETSTESGSWILGASFLSRFFSIYNFQSKVIGFVTAA